MTAFFIALILAFNAHAISIPDSYSGESLLEQKHGSEFLQEIWRAHTIDDIEAQAYLKLLGFELVEHSKNPDKHFDFFLMDDVSINAFAGSYGYIGVNSGLLFEVDSEAELAGVLSHEISHVTQNHLQRFEQKTSKHRYVMMAGLLAAVVLTDNPNLSSAIATSALAGTTQRSINFTREHEWEADRIGTKMLLKSGFNPKGMAQFFEKLKDDPQAQEFLSSHPLSINRIVDAEQRAARATGEFKADSFAYLTIKTRLYYQQYQRIERTENAELAVYLRAFEAFEDQDYGQAKTEIDALLSDNQTNSALILAGRIYAKLNQLTQAQAYFARAIDDEAAIYYAADAYLDANQPKSGIALLKRYLRQNQGLAQSYQLLAILSVRANQQDRAHLYNGEALILQGQFEAALVRFQRAKSLTNSQDLFDVLDVKIERLAQQIDLYEELPD